MSEKMEINPKDSVMESLGKVREIEKETETIEKIGDEIRDRLDAEIIRFKDDMLSNISMQIKKHLNCDGLNNVEKYVLFERSGLRIWCEKDIMEIYTDSDYINVKFVDEDNDINVRYIALKPMRLHDLILLSILDKQFNVLDRIHDALVFTYVSLHNVNVTLGDVLNLVKQGSDKAKN